MKYIETELAVIPSLPGNRLGIQLVLDRDIVRGSHQGYFLQLRH